MHSVCSEQNCLLCSKLVPPPPLVEEIDRALKFGGPGGFPSSPLLLIEAPAGFGKTTLVRQWWAYLKAQGANVAWLSFRETNCNAEHVLVCLHAALYNLFGPSDDREISGPATGFSTSQGRTVIFLDDIHHVAPSIVAVLSQFLLRSAPGLQIVATSRKPLCDAFCQSGLAGRLEIRGWADLAYSSVELQALLPRAISADAVDALRYRLKGWPALVRLLHNVARRWPSAMLDFALGHVCLEDADYYFLEEIYCELDSREREVLDLAMKISQLSPAIIQEVLGFTDAIPLLERLHGHYGLLEVFGEGGEDGAYRVHELIRHLARRSTALGSAEIHRRIAKRFELRGDLAQAVFHAVEAGDTKYSAELLRRAGGWNTALQIGSGTLDRLCHLVNAAPSDVQLRVAAAYAQLQSGRIAEAWSTVAGLRQELLSGTPSGVAQSEYVVLDLLVAHYQNRMITPDLVDRLRRQMADEPSVDHRVQLVLNTHFRAYAYYDVGDYEKSLRWLQAAAEGAEESGLFYAQVYALVFSALASFRIGALSRAAASLQQAEHVAGRRLNGIDLQRHQSMIQNVNMLVGWEHDDELLSLSEITAIEGRILAGYDSWPPNSLCFYLCTSEMIAAQCDLAAGLSHLDRGIALAQREGWQRITAELTIRKIFLCLEYGALEQASDLFGTLEPNIISAPTDPHLVELARLAQAWQALAAGDGGEALAILEPLNRALSYRGHGNNLTLGYALAGLAKAQLGYIQSARQLIVAAVGPDKMRSRSRWFKRLHRLAEFTLGDVWPIRGPWLNISQNPLEQKNSILTERESQTLSMLADGFCAKEIARLLNITPSTVASYRKQGYRKLGISKRSEITAGILSI
ncbi:helix-turn-helix transcriptional regulator [Sphingobium aquiterrae]|uniref:helix-turn-helix transcriptional regulator n=1 Tax=Sphingobium aquiterrae TaxID=2038656 RepID=UPI003016AD79